MSERLQKIESSIFDFFRIYSKYIISELLIGLLIYFMLMSSNLVNHVDGLWHPSNFIAGDWEISLGRGLQRYADRARFGIVTESFNTILTLSLIAVANALILSTFGEKSIFFKWIMLIILVANPVVCNSLTYSYMSVNFGLAYFFSVAAFTCTIQKTRNKKKNILSVIFIGGFLIGISLAFYQAYIGVTCVLILLFAIKMILEENSKSDIFKYLGISACVVVLGGLIYLIITKALLFRAGIEMATYKGASNSSLLVMLKNLPVSIEQCYLQFINYFLKTKALSDLEFINIVLVGLFAIYIVAIIVQFIKLCRNSFMHALVFLLLVALIPVASCFVLLLAVGNILTPLMSMGLVVGIVMMGVVIPTYDKIGFWMKRSYLLILIMFAWFQLSAVTNDQLALKEGKTATITLAENIISQLYEKDYLTDNRAVAFVGRPGNNHTFSQSLAYRTANEYAKFGLWSTESRNNRVSWQGLISNFLGVNLNYCGDSEYQEIIASEQVDVMPEFPQEGSICVIGDVVVVKVSEVY